MEFKNRELVIKKLTVMLIVVILAGCAANKPHKKLKPGKPIPCPQKDC